MTTTHTPGARRVVPRTRGALSGVALVVLGLWGALIPFVGPYFDFSYTPDKAWHWTAARGWLEVLPGAVAVVAGLLLLAARSRLVTLVAAWLGVAAGGWFAVGRELEQVWHLGSPGRPAGSSAGLRALESLAMFSLLGVAVVFVAAAAFGRLSVVSLRDAHAAERREAAAAEQAERDRQAAYARDREAAAARDRDAAAAREREAAAAGAAGTRDDTRVLDERGPADDAARTHHLRAPDHRAHDHRALHADEREPVDTGTRDAADVTDRGAHEVPDGADGREVRDGVPAEEQGQHASLGQRLFHRS